MRQEPYCVATQLCLEFILENLAFSLPRRYVLSATRRRDGVQPQSKRGDCRLLLSRLDARPCKRSFAEPRCTRVAAEEGNGSHTWPPRHYLPGYGGPLHLSVLALLLCLREK